MERRDTSPVKRQKTVNGHTKKGNKELTFSTKIADPKTFYSVIPESRCTEEDMDLLSGSEDTSDTISISQSSDDLDEEESIEDYIRHLEDIRSLTNQDFDLLKESIREQNTL